MTLTGKPVEAINKNGQTIKFWLNESRSNNPTIPGVHGDLFRYVQTNNLIADDLLPGSYLTIYYDDAKAILDKGKRDLIVYIETYIPKTKSHWIILKKDSPVESLTKKITNKMLHVKFGDHLTIDQLEAIDNSTDSMCYIFVMSN